MQSYGFFLKFYPSPLGEGGFRLRKTDEVIRNSSFPQLTLFSFYSIHSLSQFIFSLQQNQTGKVWQKSSF